MCGKYLANALFRGGFPGSCLATAFLASGFRDVTRSTVFRLTLLCMIGDLGLVGDGDLAGS